MNSDTAGFLSSAMGISVGLCTLLAFGAWLAPAQTATPEEVQTGLAMSTAGAAISMLWGWWFSRVAFRAEEVRG